MSYGASELDQQNTTTNSNIGFRYDVVYAKLAQSFLPGKTGALDKVIFKLAKNNSPTGNINCYLYGGDNTTPTGSALSTSSTTIDASTLGTTVAEITFNFPGDYCMIKNTRYWIQLESSVAINGTNYILIAQNSAADAYTSGNLNRYNSSTLAWMSDQGTNDLYFKEYLLPKTADGAFLLNMI